MIKISVLIATYNRAHIIDHCLQSLVEQTASQDEFEVIVINNNSSDNTDKLVQSFVGKIKNLKLIHEENQGLSYARNAGIAAAQGEWIASLDDDAKAHKNWIEIILRETQRGNFDCIGGPYLAWHHYGPAPMWFDQEWETSIHNFVYYSLIDKYHPLPTGGNCAFKKDIIRFTGLFPLSLGMKGNKCAYGEETKFFEDIRAAGFRLGSIPDLLIDHCVLPYKYTLTWRVKSAYAYGIAIPHIYPMRTKLHQLPLRIANIAKQVAFIPLHIFVGLRKKFAWQRIFLECIAPIAEAIGIAKSSFSIFLKNMRQQYQK